MILFNKATKQGLKYKHYLLLQKILFGQVTFSPKLSRQIGFIAIVWLIFTKACIDITAKVRNKGRANFSISLCRKPKDL